MSLADLCFRPRSIAIVGASDDPNKIGGRPLLYLRQFGYAGRVFPINPHRPQVQGEPAFRDVASLPEAPDLAIVVTPPAGVADAIDACIARGVGAAIVMTSGFSETGRPDAIEREQRLVERARAGGLRVVGPNTQGLANFANGAVASFSTLFLETAPLDGPVAIVSQSGIMSVVPLGLLRRAGIGVRYALASGNEADVSAADLAMAALEDSEIRLLLLYLESIRNPESLARVAARARERDVPIVAVKAGRSARGQAAAASHTAALASDSRLVDAFFRHHGIWRANDIHELVSAAPLYLRGWRPSSRSLVVVSNSGASCVMAADTAQDLGLPLSTFDAGTRQALGAVTPSFASVSNPIDLTAELMHDSAMLGRVLDVLSDRPAGRLVSIELPVTGAGYDLALLARDAARFAARTNDPVVISTPQTATADIFRAHGHVVFDNPTDALRALRALVAHTELMDQARMAPPAGTGLPTVDARRSTVDSRRPARDGGCFLDEGASLSQLSERGLPVVAFEQCRDEASVVRAIEVFGPRVAVKACSSDVPHKARLGLVSLGVADAASAVNAFRAFGNILRTHGFRDDGVLVQPMISGRAEVAVGALRDPSFGPVVMIGKGGTSLEQTGAVTFLMTPVRRAAIADALGGLPLTIAEVDALYRIADGLGDVLAHDSSIQSIDANPVIVGVSGDGVVIVDALIERAAIMGPLV